MAPDARSVRGHGLEERTTDMDNTSALVLLDQIGRFVYPVPYDGKARPTMYLLALTAAEVARSYPEVKGAAEKGRIMLRAATILLQDEAAEHGLPATFEECSAVLQHREPTNRASHPEGNSITLETLGAYMICAAVLCLKPTAP